MKILCLYNNDCALELFQWISEQGHEVVLHSGQLDNEWCVTEKFDLTLSYTYRYILTSENIVALSENVVNIHNSYLPWNRGADPNIWSVLEGTPRGVTLHYVDEELDKGFIIAQKFVIDGENETLSSSYSNLDRAAKELFKEAFHYYPFWAQMKKKAIGKGSYHSVKDGLKVKMMFDSYSIAVTDLKNLKTGGGGVLNFTLTKYAERCVA